MRSSARTASSRASSIRTSARKRTPRSGSRNCRKRYEVLKDPEKRAAYDQLGRRLAAGPGIPATARLGQGLRVHAGARRTRRAAAGPAAGADFSDFFSELFGARSPFGGAQGFEPAGRGGAGRGFAAAGQDHVARVEIDLEDAYRGGTRTIELRTPEITPDGHVTSKPRTLRVSIPAGVVEGQQIRLAGQGSAGIGGGPPATCTSR